MLLWSRAVAPRLDPYTTVHLDRLTAEGFAELGVQIGHDDLGSLEGSMFYRLSEFTSVLMFLIVHELLGQLFHDLELHHWFEL